MYKLLNLSNIFRRELRLNEVDKEIRVIWNSYNILQEYQDNKDQVSKEFILSYIDPFFMFTQKNQPLNFFVYLHIK